MICWIHGAMSTPRSFNYIRSNLPDHPELVFEYSVNTPIRDNLAVLTELLENNPVTAIVGHSLGGVLGTLMKIRLGIPKIVTLASPLGGSMIANFLPVSRMLYDVASVRPIYKEIARHSFDHSSLCIVTSNDGGYSDGVVTVQSQLSAHGCKIKHVDINHFEVLLDPYVKDLILEHLF